MDNRQGHRPFPLPLPPSLQSYSELFQREPHEAIKRLENQLRKREYDPVCTILLAWFHKEIGDASTASYYAIKAKLFAPGSPLLSFSSYYLDHSDQFDAIVPVDAYEGELPGFFVERTLSLDELIERLSSGDNSKISLQDGPTELKPDAETVLDDTVYDQMLATETLAKIYENQGAHEKAAQVYEALLANSPGKADEYLDKIASLRSAP